jgi:hypothetical protein
MSKARDIVTKLAKSKGLGIFGTKKSQSSEFIRDVARKYNSSKGLPGITHESELPQLDPNLAAKIAQAHADMKHDPNHPEVRTAYNALINETKDQYNHLIDHGFKFSPITEDMDNPYPTSKHMLDDVNNNKHLWYFPTTGGFGPHGDESKEHPLLQIVTTKDGKTIPANDVFRAVHDVFGHAKEGNGFGPRGEEAAWKHHMQMYTPDAQKALTAETRMQNHYVNWGPNAEHNKKDPKNTIYAPQKAGLPPDWVMNTHHQVLQKSQSAKLKKDQLPGGKGDSKPDSAFDKKQLSLGRKVEMEHVNSANLANEITKDHLTEDPNYYSKLKEAGLADELEKTRGDWRMNNYSFYHLSNPKDSNKFVVYASDGSNSDAGYAKFRIVNHPKHGKVLMPDDAGGQYGVYVQKEHRRQGLATGMYEHAEKVSGLKIVPSEFQSPGGEDLWSPKDRSFGKSSESNKARLIVADLEKSVGRVTFPKIDQKMTRPDQQVADFTDPEMHARVFSEKSSGMYQGGMPKDFKKMYFDNALEALSTIPTKQYGLALGLKYPNKHVNMGAYVLPGAKPHGSEHEGFHYMINHVSSKLGIDSSVILNDLNRFVPPKELGIIKEKLNGMGYSQEQHAAEIVPFLRDVLVNEKHRQYFLSDVPEAERNTVVLRMKRAFQGIRNRAEMVTADDYIKDRINEHKASSSKIAKSMSPKPFHHGVEPTDNSIAEMFKLSNNAVDNAMYNLYTRRLKQNG